MHKAGFVNIIGSPNVGKSTLMNLLVGERVSIITSKAQTTRHRIMGIVNSEDYQLVYSDTPGVLEPNYKLQESMMKFVDSALVDADIILWVTDIFEKEVNNINTLEKIKKTDRPVFVLINKMDIAKENQIEEKIAFWAETLPKANIQAISALQSLNTHNILTEIVRMLPESPPFFSKDELTDKPLRFFVAEIIREKIFLNYKKEIPYSCEVVVEEFKEEEKITRIRALIYVSRESQKGIVIGHKGRMLKKIGTEARLDIEAFIDKKVFLEFQVKVDKDWRNKQNRLKQYGYV